MELLKVEGVGKRFGATKALDGVSLSVQRGTIHSLLGRNGAGKSTLVNIIAGILPADRGRVLFAGEDISGQTVAQRQAMGIRIVTQHASIIPELSLAENIFLGVWPRRRGLVDFRRIYERAAEELSQYGLDFSPKVRIKTLPAVEQRKVNIVRALFGGAKLIILDEPTTALSHDDRENLFHFIEEQTASGSSFIFISHYLGEAARISHHVTVFRDGRTYNGHGSGEVSERRLAKLIAGDEVTPAQRCLGVQSGETVLRCTDIRGTHMNAISFSLRRGEVLGLVGLPGSGARSLVRALYGLNPVTGGTIEIENRAAAIASPEDALRLGIAYIPNERHTEGIVETLSIRENIGLSILRTLLHTRAGFVNRKEEEKLAHHYREELSIKCGSIEDPLARLSGGNQQKVVIAKILSCRPKILILDEPTIGIDIQSREEILTRINQISRRGAAVLYLTNDFDELRRIADRFLLFRRGRLESEVANENLSEEEIMAVRDHYVQNADQSEDKEDKHEF